MLLEQINSDIKDAMRAKEASKLLTLRTLKGEIQRRSDNPTDADVLSVVKNNIDGIKETTNDAAEIAVLESYQPVKLSDEDVFAMTYSFVKKEKLSGMADMGKVMNYFKDNYLGQYDGKALSGIVKGVLVV